MLKTAILKSITNLNVLFALLLLATIGVTLQQYFLGLDHIGNFLIFKTSFFHFIKDQPMYSDNQMYKGIPIDMYKYSPSFAVLFAPLSLLPDLAGVILWNLINTLVLFFSIKSLPLADNKKPIIILLIFLELVISLQNCQSNPLMAGLLIFSYAALEKKNVLLGTLCIVLSIYIKLFGIVALIMGLFYPRKIKFVLYTVMWIVVLFLLPMVFIDFGQLLRLYHDWATMLKQDQTISWGLSVMTILKMWFGLDLPKVYVQLAGALLLCLPLINKNRYKDKRFHLLYLCSIMIWTIIFNHRAESPTFIIALSAMAIWFVSQKATRLNIGLILFALLFTSFATSDLVPKHIRYDVIAPYALKALPSLVLWLIIQYTLMFRKDFWQEQHSTGE